MIRRHPFLIAAAAWLLLPVLILGNRWELLDLVPTVLLGLIITAVAAPAFAAGAGLYVLTSIVLRSHLPLTRKSIK
jgi:hypothetical protein